METLLQGSLLLQDTDVAEATEVAEATVHLDMVVGLSHSAPHHDHPGPHVAHFGGHSDSVDQDSVHEVSVIMGDYCAPARGTMEIMPPVYGSPLAAQCNPLVA